MWVSIELYAWDEWVWAMEFGFQGRDDRFSKTSSMVDRKYQKVMYLCVSFFDIS